MLYLDTSALLKTYIAEVGSAVMVAAVAAATAVATSIVAYAESRAAFARALRDGRLSAADHTMHVRTLDTYWTQYIVIAADEVCVRDAGQLSDKHTGHALRALDAIHLASALTFAGADRAGVTFACWDVRLWRAARDEGFTMLPAVEPV